MSRLEELAHDLAAYLLAHTCGNPACERLIEDDEPFCSQACAEAFAVWDAEMRAFHDDDHETELWELGESA